MPTDSQMKTETHDFLILLFTFLLFPYGVANAQDAGGPYTPDANTILLMHFDGNLDEEASNYAVVDNGPAKSYIASPISGLGDAIYFDNSNPSNRSYLTVPHSAELSLTSNWTIEFWFTINAWDQSHNSWPVPILLPTAGWNANYYLEIPSTEGRLRYAFHSSDGDAMVYSSLNSITTGTWYHVALINDYDNHTIKLILRDADFQKLEEPSASYTAGTTISTGTQDLRIGNGTAGDNAFNGYIDELRISNVVRDYSIQYDWETTSSDNFLFHYTNLDLYNDDLATSLENKFEDLDFTIYEHSSNINLLDRSQRINVYLYDADQPMPNASAELRDWDVGYYTQNEIHIRVPSTERQLRYFPNFEKAAISVLARYVMAKKRPSGTEPSKGLSFGYGLYESGYSPDLTLIQNYLAANNNTFPNSSTFNTWLELDDETNVELAYTFVFASIFRHGYLTPTAYDGLYDYDRGAWYQIIRIFFLTDIEDGGMRKYIDEDDFIIYSNSQVEADLVLEGLRWYANICETVFDVRINHPLLVTIYGSAETYTYTKYGNIDVVESGGEALSHNLLRSVSGAPNSDTELNRALMKHNNTMQHEFTHNVISYLSESTVPTWLNEGAAMNTPEPRIYGYIGMNIQNFENHHDNLIDQNLDFPDLTNVFDPGAFFGYHMSYSAFTFVQDNISKAALIQFLKQPDNFSIIGYNSSEEFQTHLYKSLYHRLMPDYLFSPGWDVESTFTAGNNYKFDWEGHYIENLVIEYSVDGMNSWNYIADVPFFTGTYSWTIPNTSNSILRFSDKLYPDIKFTYPILGNKPLLDTVLYMSFENEVSNIIRNGNNGRLKGQVSFESRAGENGLYATFGGMWDLINVPHYESLSLNEDWTIQGEFIIENTTGVMNGKPVLINKMATNKSNKNYSVRFNKNGLKHLFFEYDLTNNTTISLEVDANVSEGNWYTFYFARSRNNNIVEARVYDQYGNILASEIRQIIGEEQVLTGNGDLYMGGGRPSTYEEYLQGGLDNIMISDTYHSELMPIIINEPPVVVNAPRDIELLVADDAFAQDLSTVCSDADGDALSYTATSSDEAVAIVTVESNTMTVTAVATGSTTITITASDGRGGEANTSFVVNVPSGVAVEDLGGEVPTEYALDQNYPNPFNPITTIQWALPEAGHVTMRIYNVQGVEIATLMDEPFPPGRYSVSWDASDFASGMYMYRIEVGKYADTKALILIK